MWSIALSRRSLLGLALALVVEAGRRAKDPTGGPAHGTGLTSTAARGRVGGSVVQIGGPHVPPLSRSRALMPNV